MPARNLDFLAVKRIRASLECLDASNGTCQSDILKLALPLLFLNANKGDLRNYKIPVVWSIIQRILPKSRF